MLTNQQMDLLGEMFELSDDDRLALYRLNTEQNIDFDIMVQTLHNQRQEEKQQQQQQEQQQPQTHYPELDGGAF